MERTRGIFRRPVVWIILVIVGAIALSSFFTGGQEYTKVDTSVALSELRNGNVKKAVLEDREQNLVLDLNNKVDVKGQQTDRINAQVPAQAIGPIWAEIDGLERSGKIADADVKVTKDSVLLSFLINLLPIAVLVILLLLFMSQMQGGGSRVLNFGKSKAKLVAKDTPKTTFADVAGADEAVQELHEIKDFLQNPAKYQALGAKIPKGVLLYGPPGTGKTLLARAVAGEAGCPFYSISGSDFVEMFVGVGASRVRDLFEQAKANAPAIVFVDEIDAVGRHRGAGLGGGHDEREQTLNQLLVEMDGFTPRAASSSSPPPTGRTFSTRLCFARAGSTARSPWMPPTWRAVRRSCGCTPRASRSRPTLTSTRSPAALLASRVPTSPTSSTRRLCSRREMTSAPSRTTSWRSLSTG